MALRNKSFGSAQEFVWCSTDASMYAVRESNNTIKIYRNFKEIKSFKPDFGADGWWDYGEEIWVWVCGGCGNIGDMGGGREGWW